MVVGDIATGTQVAIIGAGPGGYVAAIRAAQLGKDVTLIEKEPQGLGGVCLNHGCIPSKALIYAVNVYSMREKFLKMGLTFSDVKLDMAKMQLWKQANVDQLRNGIAMLMKKHGVNIIQGEATFDSSRKLRVITSEGMKYIEFERAIIATGSRSATLEGFEPDGEIVLTSTEALQLNNVPRRIIVIGGGYIAVELGMMYAKLGTKVTIIERFTMLSSFDRDLILPIRERMKTLGIEVYEKTACTRISKSHNKAIVFANSEEIGDFALEAEKVLVAVGRKPNTDKLGLEKTQVQLDDKGFIKVDEKRKTRDPYIYAIGDVTGQPMLAHKGFLEGKVAAEAIAGLPSAFEPQAIPIVIFSDPEIACVGLSESEAEKKGYKVKVGKFPLSALGRAVSVNKNEGFVKVISDQETQLILGVQFVAAHASDLISEAALGIEMGFTLDDLALTIHPHPTFPEAMMEAAEAALGKAIHIWQGKSQ